MKKCCLIIILLFVILTVWFAKDISEVFAATSDYEFEYDEENDNLFITNIDFETTVSEFLENISDKSYDGDTFNDVTVTNISGEDITEKTSELITTGCTVTTSSGVEYTTIIPGDLDGDGKYSYRDVLIEQDYVKYGYTNREY